MAGRPTWPGTRAETARYSRGPCSNAPCTAVDMFVYTGRVHGRVDGPYTATARTRPQRAVWERVHGPVGLPAIYTAHTALVHGRVTAEYIGCVTAVHTSVYTASTQSCTWQVDLHSRVHGPRRHAMAVGRVHGRGGTRSCTRPIHSRVHVRLHGPCTRPRTRTVCRNEPHTAVACRLGTCTRPGRPICRIHGPDGPCTRPCNGRVHGLCNGCVHIRVHGQHTVVYMAGRLTRPATLAETARYGRGRVHGRNAPCTLSCTRPIHSRVDVPLHGPCTRPITRAVCRNVPHTAVACRLGTCTRPG